MRASETTLGQLVRVDLPKAGWRSLVLLVVAMLLAGCGYTLGNRSGEGGAFPAGIRSVSVPIFENHTFYRGVEFDVTEAIIKEIELRTPYKVTSASGADTILRGSIVSIEQGQLARREEGGLPEEVEVQLVVDLEWKNLQTGEVLRQRQGLAVVGRYVPAAPVSQPYEFAQHQAAARLANQVISIMRADW